MPLKWKTTGITNATGYHEVLHQPQDDPHKLMKSLRGNPVRFIGDSPSVWVHRFGKQLVVARNYPRRPGFDEEHNVHYDSVGSFRALVHATDNGATIVETPIAFIKGPTSHKIVTKWIERPKSLVQFLEKKGLNKRKKLQVCLKVAELIGQMHAAGIRHHRLNLYNVILSRAGKPTLIDPTHLSPYIFLDVPPDRRYVEDISRQLAAVYKENTGINEPLKKITARFQKEHDKWYGHYKKRNTEQSEKVWKKRMKSKLS